MKQKRRTNSGLTLFEILIAIVILSLLAVVSYLGMITQIKKARDAKRKADLEKIKIALYDYCFDNGCFPENLPECGQDIFPCDPLGYAYAYETEASDYRQWFKVMTNLENIRDQDIDKVGCRQGCGLPDCPYNYGVASSNILIYDGCVAYFACLPGGEDHCVEFEDPWISECPRIFQNDPTCQGVCGDKINRCKNASGKKVPD